MLRAMSYDALVVGSGSNGLSAAITMAGSGWRVLVLEAAERAGGAVATEELTLPGFLHDTFSAVYPSGAASPVFAGMPLERHGLRWVHPPACLAHPLPDGTAAALYRDLDRTVASLEDIHAGDGERWRAFASPFVEHFDALRHTMLGGFPPVRGTMRLAAGLGPRGVLDFTRLLLMSARALGEELFEDDGTRAWLYGSAMHSDVPPVGGGSAIAAVYLNLLGHGVGWPSPEGGAGRLADALIAHLRELGGEVRTGAKVTSIATERGRAVGVELDGGERVGARVVVADVMPSALAALAGDALPARYASALRRYRVGPSTLKLDWALDGPIPWTAPQAREAGTVHLGGSAPEVLRTTAIRDDLPERPFMLLGQQSLADPSRARPPVAGLGGRARPPCGAHGGPGRALRAGLSRPDPGPSRPRPGRPAGPQRESPRRRRRRRQLHARPGRLPPGTVARALPHARARTVSGQRGDVPGWRGARRAGPRSRAPGADRGARQAPAARARAVSRIGSL
jgi:phytoene dehydrogenase-like protein